MVRTPFLPLKLPLFHTYFSVKQQNWHTSYSKLTSPGMILVDQPWYNEPGRELRQDKNASKNYNTMIQGFTVTWALTDWLKNRLAPTNTTPGGSRPAPTSSGRPASILPWSNMPMPPDPNGEPASVPRDDPVWGEVIRKHFAANGKTIFETASKKWKIHKDELAKLRDALGQHGYL